MRHCRGRGDSRGEWQRPHWLYGTGCRNDAIRLNGQRRLDLGHKLESCAVHFPAVFQQAYDGQFRVDCYVFHERPDSCRF